MKSQLNSILGLALNLLFPLSRLVPRCPVKHAPSSPAKNAKTCQDKNASKCPNKTANRSLSNSAPQSMSVRFVNSLHTLDVVKLMTSLPLHVIMTSHCPEEKAQYYLLSFWNKYLLSFLIFIQYLLFPSKQKMVQSPLISLTLKNIY